MQPWLDAIRREVDAALDGHFASAWPSAFAVPLAYPLQPGGKRIRPALCLCAHDAVGGTHRAAALQLALAVELVHTYSLVHDDLPAMDDDDQRRGRPATHKAHGEAVAILVGDALLTEAFAVIAAAPLTPAAVVTAVRELATAAGYRGMVGGQAADIGVEGPAADVATLTRLHQMKTGALLRVSAVLGGVAAGADPDHLEALGRYGAAVGLAFQLADDLLDAEEDEGNESTPSYPRLLGRAATAGRAAAALDEALAESSALPFPERLEALARFAVHRTW